MPLPPVPAHTAAPQPNPSSSATPTLLSLPSQQTSCFLSFCLPVWNPPSGTTFDTVNPALLHATLSAGPPGRTQASLKTLVTLPPDPPLPGSLAVELAVEAAHKLSDKERKAQHLGDFIKTNIDPTSRGCHLAAKEKWAASSSTGEIPFLFLLPPYSTPFHSH